MKKIFLALFVVAVAACNDEENTPTVAEFLSAPQSGWIQTSVLVTIPGTTTKVDVYSDASFEEYYPACMKDNALVFKSDGNYSIESTVKCDTAEPSTLETGKWSLSADQKTITFTPNGAATRTASILNINESELKVDVTLEVDSRTVSATVTLKPK